jgi:hypothetical protein
MLVSRMEKRAAEQSRAIIPTKLPTPSDTATTPCDRFSDVNDTVWAKSPVYELNMQKSGVSNFDASPYLWSNFSIAQSHRQIR